MATDIKVFICYAREDMAIAKKLYKDLQQAGVKPWLDIKDLQPGQQWKTMIADTLKHSDYVLVLLSSHSLNKKGYFRKDLNDALTLLELVPPDKSFLIPVRLEDCKPKKEELQDLQWCDLFESYDKGVNQILKVIYPNGIRIHLRSEPLVVSLGGNYREVFQLDRHNEPLEYIRNDYEDLGEIILDHTTGLMWQKSGPDREMRYEKTQSYIDKLNHSQFAGYDDWRLPTIPELMSLIEPEKQSNRMFINPIFDTHGYEWCWSADKIRVSMRAPLLVWYVFFSNGDVNKCGFNDSRGVRCVRSRRVP